jgi:hypothetical protein
VIQQLSNTLSITSKLHQHNQRKQNNNINYYKCIESNQKNSNSNPDTSYTPVSQILYNNKNKMPNDKDSTMETEKD